MSENVLNLSLVITSCAAVTNSYAATVGANMYANKLSTALDTSLDSKNKEKKFSGDFSMRSNQLVGDVGEVVGNQYWGDLNLKYKSGGNGESIKKFEFASRANDQTEDFNSVMFSVPEAYYEIENDNSNIAFGRKILEWGYIDAVWGFGKINNRKNFDGFEPGLEGLTGLLFEKSSGGMKFSLFGSLIYIPEMNPGQDYDEDNGTITCNNPWCRPVPSSAPIDGGSNVDIVYNIDYPEISEVVFRYSTGARLAMDMGPFEIEAYGLRKPENTIEIAGEVYYTNEDGKAFVNVTPQIYYHDVLGANVKFKINDYITAYGGGMSVTPNTFPDGYDPRIEYTGIKPKKKKEDYLGTGAFYNGGKFKGGIHYVARVSEFDIEEDILVQYPRWNQAINVNMSSILTRTISVAFDVKYDMLTEDRLTMFSASYLVAPNMLTTAGVNMIGTSGNAESYWSEFSNNDSVYGSLKYQF